MKEIYQQTVEEVLERVNGKKSGLTSEQVKRSREKCGWDELTEGKKKGILQIFLCSQEAKPVLNRTHPLSYCTKRSGSNFRSIIP